ncbi:MAG: type II toxin-antitoxin system VapB family antitoxin [Pirellulales bacterium]
MRTTLRINDGLMADAKQLALDRGRTLTEIVEDALRVFLAQQRSKQVPQQPLQLHIVRGQGLQPGVDLSSNAALADLMDQHDGPTRR